MKSHYGKSTQQLMMDYFEEINLKNGESFKKSDVYKWFKKNYPNIKENTVQCCLIKLSVNAPSRWHYKAREDGSDDILCQLSGDTFRLYDRTKDVVINNDTIEDEATEDETLSQEFAYERDLRNYLEKNLSSIESGLKLFEEDDITGIEYPAGGRFIDILALDRDKNFVIIELKVSKGYDRVVGQLLRYMNWVKKNLADEGQKVRGMIVCKEITEDLSLACWGLKDIELFEYELSLKLTKKTL
jgi:hypothetical protein